MRRTPSAMSSTDAPAASFGDFGATDVWSLTGVDPADAVIGVRENSDKLVIFVRVGVKPSDLPLPAP